MTILSLLLAAAQAGAAPPAAADPLGADLRCLMALSVMADQVPQAQRNDVMSVAIYYLGRVNARAPTLNLAERLTAEAPGFDAMGAEATRALTLACAQEVERRGRELEAAGRAAESATQRPR